MEGYDKSAKKIIIPEGTEFIPDYAFKDYKNPEENFRDINAFIAEKMRAQENIEVDVVVYEKLHEAVRIIRGKGKELIDEFQEPLKKYVF